MGPERVSATVAVRWALIIAVTLCLQVGLAGLRVGGVALQLLPLLAVCSGVIAGSQRGAVVGFWAGFVFDLALPGPLGLSALAYCLVAFGIGSLQATILQMARGISILLVALGTAAAVLLFAVFGEVFGDHTLGTPRLGWILLVIWVSGAALAPFGLRLARWAEGPDARLPGVLAEA